MLVSLRGAHSDYFIPPIRIVLVERYDEGAGEVSDLVPHRIPKEKIGRTLPVNDQNEDKKCHVNGRQKYGISPQCRSMSTLQPTALIVNGLSLSLTSEDLREIFSEFGPVMWTHIATDGSREALGFGYVVMNAEDAVKAIQALDGKTVAGQKVTIAHTAIPPLPGIAEP